MCTAAFALGPVELVNLTLWTDEIFCISLWQIFLRQDNMSKYGASYIIAQVSTITDSCFFNPKEPVIGEVVNNLGIGTAMPGFLVNEITPTWYFYILMTLFVGYAVARSYLGQLITSAFMATVRYNIAEGMYKDNSQLQRQRDNALYGLYFVTTS